jgi:hypothetical protein
VTSSYDSVFSMRRLFSNRYHGSLLKCARPKRHPAMVRSIQVHHLRPKLFSLSLSLSEVGAKLSHVVGVSNIIDSCSMCSFYFRFGGDCPSTTSDPCFLAPEGADPSTRSCFSPSATHWASRLLASRIPALGSSQM